VSFSRPTWHLESIVPQISQMPMSSASSPRDKIVTNYNKCSLRKTAKCHAWHFHAPIMFTKIVQTRASITSLSSYQNFLRLIKNIALQCLPTTLECNNQESSYTVVYYSTNIYEFHRRSLLGCRCLTTHPLRGVHVWRNTKMSFKKFHVRCTGLKRTKCLGF